jgi:hypothetical protein
MIQPPPRKPQKVGPRIHHLLIAIFWDPSLSLPFRWMNIGAIGGVTGFYLFVVGQAPPGKAPQSWSEWIIAGVCSFVGAGLAVRHSRITFRSQLRPYSRFFAWVGRLLQRLRQHRLLDLLKQDVDILFANEAEVRPQNVPASTLRPRRWIMRP